MRVEKVRGYTLVEMLIVVAIIALVAAIAIPSDSTTHHRTLELASSYVADALRFAREESRRTGTIHGVSVDLANNEIRVFRLDEGPNPNLKVFDVYHPVTKQPYVVQIGESILDGVSLSDAGGTTIGTCNDPGNIAFDSAGVVRCIEPTATRINNAFVELSSGTLESTVTTDDYTGRVVVQ